jgi:hypothetical protein
MGDLAILQSKMRLYNGRILFLKHKNKGKQRKNKEKTKKNVDILDIGYFYYHNLPRQLLEK